MAANACREHIYRHASLLAGSIPVADDWEADQPPSDPSLPPEVRRLLELHARVHDIDPPVRDLLAFLHQGQRPMSGPLAELPAASPAKGGRLEDGPPVGRPALLERQLPRRSRPSSIPSCCGCSTRPTRPRPSWRLLSYCDSPETPEKLKRLQESAEPLLRLRDELKQHFAAACPAVRLHSEVRSKLDERS